MRYLFTVLALLGGLSALTTACSVDVKGGDPLTPNLGGNTDTPDENKPTPVEQPLVVSALGAWEQNRVLILNPNEEEAGAIFAITPTEDLDLKLIQTLEGMTGCSPSEIKSAWLGLRMVDQDTADQMFGVSLNQYFHLEKGHLYHLILSLKGMKSCSRYEYKFVAERK